MSKRLERFTRLERLLRNALVGALLLAIDMENEEKLTQRVIQTSVRPARVAVMIDRDDKHWRNTCRRVIENFSVIWGGNRNIIIPTDGTHIESSFWHLLKAFDADFIATYKASGLDNKLNYPSDYAQQLELEADRIGTADSPSARQELIEQIAKSYCQTSATDSLSLQPELQGRLIHTVAPCHFEKNQIIMTLSAHCSVPHECTPMRTVLQDSLASKLIHVPQLEDDHLALWVASLVGGLSERSITDYRDDGIRVEEQKVLTFDVVDHALPMPSSDRQEYFPFDSTMEMLSTYRHRSFLNMNEPIVLVAGDTVDDFCLYYSLSRIRDRVCWLDPSLFNSLSPSDLRVLANTFAARLIMASRYDRRPVNIVSTSLDEEELRSTVGRLAASSGNHASEMETLIEISTVLKHVAVQYPLMLYNTDNVDVPIVGHFVDGSLVGGLQTPKPKGFESIPVIDMPWMTQIRISGAPVPRHPVMGVDVVQHAHLFTSYVRSGRDGISYYSPNILYKGSGDIDSSLLRPMVRLRSARWIFEKLISTAKWKSQLSDKGFYSQETMSKLGGMERAAQYLKNEVVWKILRKFLEGPAEPSNDESAFVQNRRYLSMRAFEQAASSAEMGGAVIDDLVERDLLHRGVILQCRMCRYSNWYSLRDINDSFDCKRCRRVQKILRENWKSPDEPRWYYELDEVAYLAVRNNWHVPLLALEALRVKSESFTYMHEVAIYESEEKTPWIECDFACIADGRTIIGEAKSANQIDKSMKEEKKTISAYLRLAEGIGCSECIFATSAEGGWTPATAERIRSIFKRSDVEAVLLERNALYA